MHLSGRAHAAVLALAFLLVLAARLANLGILWAEEAYPTAAALEVLEGKVLYRDVWFDKPPLYALAYLLWGARTGVGLRLGGALFVVLAAGLAYRFALELWGRDEALLAGVFAALYLTFGIPSAVMALAPDLLLVAPHLAAVYLAWRGQAFGAGLAAGLGFAVNAKGALVLAVCLLWQWRRAPALLAGFALPTGALALALAGAHAWSDYVRQVWEWGLLYSRSTFLEHPVREGVLRTLNWAGFQAAAVVGTVWFFLRERAGRGKWRFAVWLALAVAAVAPGWRFFPRYYFLPLAAVCVLGARGVMLSPRWARVAALALLLIPVIRFGPRLVLLGRDRIEGLPHVWRDLAMIEDSQQAAALVRQRARPGDTLLVWGYRAELYPFTGLRAGSRFLDSQPLTGVLADRHLVDARASAPEWAEQNRRELIQTKPAFIVDGLGPYQPALAIGAYPDLREWLADYEAIGRTAGALVYRRR